MEFIIKKFCHYILVKDNNELDEIKEYIHSNNLNYKKIKKQAHNMIRKIKNDMKELGYDIDFDSFCNCISNYIDIKDNMDEGDKLKYLQILFPVSEIYDVSLKDELSKYISYKNNNISKDLIIDNFCRYYLNPYASTNEFNDLKKICGNYDFNELESEALKIIEPLREDALKLGYETDFNSFCNMLDYYNHNHSNLSDSKKEEYLRCLLRLSKIYEVDLRNELIKYSNKSKDIVRIDLPYVVKNITNPLDNKLLLKKILLQRYEECNFSIKDIILDDDIVRKESKDFDNIKLQAKLSKRILDIFVDKINNFCEDDLNKNYLSILSDDDILRLKSISEKDVYVLLMSLKENINEESIMKKIDISNNLYKFLNLACETVNFSNEHIGIANNSLFFTEDSNFTVRIYINTPYRKESYEFISLYIEKCLLNSVSYDLSFADGNTIIYATVKDISIKLNILNEIGTDDYIKYFGTPFHGGGLINNSYYSLSHSGITNSNSSCIFNYFDYLNNIFEVSYYRVLSKIVINKISTMEEKKIIDDFINLNDVKFLYDYNNPSLARYGDYEFNKLKDLINPYIPTISSTLEKYIKEENNILDEFKKSIIYINNVCQNKDKKYNSNIVINTYLENESYKIENRKE